MRRVLVLGMASIAALAEPAWSQQAAQEAVQDDSEIVVTARRRAESLQDIPLSVTAFTAAAMERQGVSDIADIAQRTPGLQYGEFGDIKLSPTSLRGIYGGAGSAGADPAVGYYIDDVYVGQGAGANLDLYDIERVEVLRGPQGALFGRNTIGGVINITTRRPSDVFEASALGEVSNYEGRRAAASISGPLADGLLSGKLALIYDEREGTSDNIYLNRDVNDQRAFSMRAQLAFDFTTDTRLLITADHRIVDQEPLMFETLRYNNAALTPSLLDGLGLPKNTNPYDRRVLGDAVSDERLDASGIAATFETRIGGVRITNVASYRTHDYFSRTDTDRTTLSIAYDGDPEEVWRASDEIRAEFSTGPVDWLAGAYFFKQETVNSSFIEIGLDAATLLGSPSLAGFQAGSNAALDTQSAALFASGTWQISPRFDVTVGGRYTRDEKEIDYTQSDPLGLLGGDAAIQASGDWSAFTPNFNARFRATDDFMAYASASRGFKSGGFNDALGDADGISFDPETLWNYEVGFKSEFFDRRATLNVAAFYMDWSSIQIAQDDPSTPMFDPTILNGGAAHSQGVEIEAAFQATPHLLLNANLSVQDVSYDEGELPDGTPLRRIPFSPEYTGAVSAEQSFSLGAAGELILFGEYTFRGQTYLTPNNDVDGRVDPYGLINLRATYQPNDARWRVTLWGKNLGDETYITRLFDSYAQDLVGQKFVILGDPRTYGVELRVDF